MHGCTTCVHLPSVKSLLVEKEIMNTVNTIYFDEWGAVHMEFML